MIIFNKTLTTWNTSEFNNVFISDVLKMDRQQLPLQQALAQSSYVSDSKINLSILNTFEDDNNIFIKVGIFFAGIIAGSCCSDDPTPVDEIQEYCELEFKIDKDSAVTTITLLSNN